VYKQVERFQSSRTSVVDEDCSGCPITSWMSECQMN